VIYTLRYPVLYICFCAICLFVLENVQGEEAQFDPWSVAENVPITLLGEKAVVDFEAVLSVDGTLGQNYCAMLLRFYQKYLSVVAVSQCPMIPSCSRYSMEAIRKGGSFMGILMTADRLLHEGDERKYAEEIWRDDKLMYLDPVENNDFWWHENEIR
jgi:hypothetical protein